MTMNRTGRKLLFLCAALLLAGMPQCAKLRCRGVALEVTGETAQIDNHQRTVAGLVIGEQMRVSGGRSDACGQV
jgi:hypothetical protein